VIIGTNASETLVGSEGPDFICALLGDDVIYGLGGDDLILGDTTTFFGNVQAPGGDDTIFAGAGNDEVLPGPGDDTVDGGSGDDSLALAVGDDVGQGGQGSDSVIGGFGQDVVLGGPGDDELAGGFDDDLINGGPGDDFLFGELPGGGEPPPGLPVEPAENVGASAPPASTPPWSATTPTGSRSWPDQSNRRTGGADQVPPVLHGRDGALG
jgi:Ca2+-binding RTX toxin-like protein